MVTANFVTLYFVDWLDAVQKRIEGEVIAEQARLAEDAKTAMHEHGYQNRTGRLTSSMTFRTMRTGGLGFLSIIEISAPYALWVDEPTKPHFIEAKNAKYLRFNTHGHWVMKKKVHHPGTSGAWFSLRAETYYMNVCQYRLQRAVNAGVELSG